MKEAHDKGEDRSLKTQYKLLGRILYSQALPEAQRARVDEEIANGNISLSDNDDVGNPIKVVLSIVNLVAIDPPTARVTRLFSSYQDVMNCGIRRDENLSNFVSHFRGLADKQLMHAHASPSSQTGQVLAITLLNNVNLDEGTLINAKSDLIKYAKNRKDQESQRRKKESLVPISHFTPAMIAAKVLQESIEEIKTNDDGRIRISNRIMRDILNNNAELQKCVDQVSIPPKDDPAKKEITIHDLFKEEDEDLHFDLDDAVSILRDLTTGASRGSSSMSENDITNIVRRQVHSLMGNQQGLSSLMGNQ